MVLIKRKPVAILPLSPELANTQDVDRPVYYLKATGEIFTDYESYTNRQTYLSSKIFQCEASGKMNLTYFAALASERTEFRLVRERFPTELKGKVLAAVQFQIMGRFDALVDSIFERFRDRYFVSEQLFAEIEGDKYFAKITGIFPPTPVRAVAASSTPASTSTSASPPPPDYDAVAHKKGTDLGLDEATVLAEDNAEEYLYIVQLMDENNKFEGSVMEVKGSALNRDRLTFSKAILKRYIKECVQREGGVSSPWRVKAELAKLHNINTTEGSDVQDKTRMIKAAKLAKKKPKPEKEKRPRPAKDPKDPTNSKEKKPAKRRKSNVGADNLSVESGTPRSSPAPAAVFVKPHPPPSKAPKYPMEDLELDPMSIHDGRILRRVASALPDLPEKPVPSRVLSVDKQHWNDFLMIWNMLNIFSKPLSLSTFNIDDLASALSHSTSSPRCALLAEIHAALTNVISTDASRVLGSTTAAPLPTAAQTRDIERGSSVDPVDIARRSSVDMELSNIAAEDVEDLDDDLAAPETEEDLDRLVRKGLLYSKKWDRLSKLKLADGRKGWEKHIIGALCQRGAPLTMENLSKILSHLFEGPIQTTVVPTIAIKDIEKEGVAPPVPSTDSDPTQTYLTLPLEWKIEIIAYLCTLALGSKLVRTYIEESESLLTEGRKDRADVNKDRRRIVEEKTALDTAAKLAETVPAPTPVEGDGATNGNGHPDSSMNVDPLGASAGASESSKGVKSKSRQTSVDSDITTGSTDVVASIRQTAVLSKKEIDAHARKEVIEKRNADRVRQSLEEELLKNAKKDDHVEREFRRNYGVARCRPLGKDRFYNRYWWFDGIGGMSLVSGEGAKYGTGRLYVQGPSEEDAEIARECVFKFAVKEKELEGESMEIDKLQELKADKSAAANGNIREVRSTIGTIELAQKRAREEVNVEAILDIDEWAVYETEEEILTLLSWLNIKGHRELALKNALTKWKDYIITGCQRRSSPSQPDVPTSPVIPTAESSHGRRSRVKSKVIESGAVEFNEDLPNYMRYVNKLSKV